MAGSISRIPVARALPHVTRAWVRLWFAVTVLSYTADVLAQEPTMHPLLRWSQLPGLPDDHGFAAPAAGIQSGTLIVAGGANFPDGRPWDGAAKQWHDRVFVLRPSLNEWRELSKRLPGPRAYAVSISTARGVAVIGGSCAEGHLSDAYLMRLQNEDLAFEPLPPLDAPLANACGALLGDILYLAGGLEAADASETSHRFRALDLAAPADDRAWKELPAWPGPPRMLATAAVKQGAFFLIGGVDLHTNADGSVARQYLFDAYRYSPHQGWTRIADLPRPAAAAPSPAPAIGPSHLLVLGGDDGRNAARISELKDAHPGFCRTTLVYDSTTDSWTTGGALPFSLVTTPAVQDGKRVILPGGEVRPGVRTTDVWLGELSAIPVRAP